MNIICNNCASGFLYNKLNMQYANPFVWNLISAKDFENLVINWWKINFLAIDFPQEIPYDGVTITVDNSIAVKYIHIKYDETATVPVKKFVDIYTSAPWMYAYQKYITRIKRMCAMGTLPVFLISDDTTSDTTSNTVDTVRPDNSIELITRLNDANIKERIIWATPNEVSPERFGNLNLTIVHPSNQYVGTVADYLIETHIFEN